MTFDPVGKFTPLTQFVSVPIFGDTDVEPAARRSSW
jgi:hypothetical protein